MKVRFVYTNGVQVELKIDESNLDTVLGDVITHTLPGFSEEHGYAILVTLATGKRAVVTTQGLALVTPISEE